MKYNNGLIDQETRPIHLRLGRHWEKLRLDVTEQPGSDIVLGIPWLRTANPMIDWTNETIAFLGTGTTRLHPILKPPQGVEIFVMTSEEMREEFGGTNDAQVLWSREIQGGHPKDPATAIIPKEYQEYKILFEEESDQEALPKHQSWDHEIKLVDGKEPTKQSIYPLSAEKLDALRQYLEENMRKGFIRESQSPAGYPILFVPKSDGSLRLCVDYRALNNITIKNSYPLPLIAELQDRLQGAQWFTKFDIPGAFNRIRIKEGDEWKTAFRTRLGHFEYLVMPFGLTNAPATFQAFVNNVLRRYLDQFVIVYLDDILVYSKTKEEHVQHVKKVLQALKEADLRIKPGKSEFHVQSVQFLGFIVTSQGLRMDPKKIEAVTTWPTPKSKVEVQSFLGFANFYRRFIEGYSRIASPLTDLTRKDIPFVWTEKAEKAFKKLKELFTSQPVLVMFEPGKPITLETDASDGAIGACISQPDDKGRLHPIAFHSRKLTGAELNYEIHDKELLAIVDSFKQWRVYLEGPRHQVQVYTDHKNLLYFTTTKVLNRRQVRWSEELSSYNFQIQYRKGSENSKADALSRRADHMADRPQVNQAILQENPDGSIVYNRQNAATLRIDNRDLEKRVKLELAKDSVAQDIIENIEDNADFEVTNGILTFQGLIYVPTRCRQEVIDDHHKSMVHGHQGSDKTIERISRTYYFPKMRKQVEDIIRKCDVCIRTKHNRHKPYGLLKSPSTPDRAWKSIALDFIVKLPKSKERVTGTTYDSILVITDRLTKYGYFLPYKEATSAEDLAYTFLRTIVANHGLPDEIISDRDKLFTSKFWKSLVDQLGIHHKLSTAYHPQTDGQTERMNQTLEQYLRCYINYRQNDWVQLLPVAQLAFNSATTEVTSVSPFFANYGFEPETLKEPRGFAQLAQKATLQVGQLQLLQKELQKDIQFLSKRMALYANKKRVRGPTLKEGDKAYLLRRNIKTKRPSNKLDHTKLGPYRILETKGPVNYKLDLPTPMRIHPVFHICLLEPANADTPIQTEPPGIDPESQNAEYEVEDILDQQDITGQPHWLVKWKGYDHTEDTWEPEKNLKNCQKLLRQFQQRNPTTSRNQEGFRAVRNRR